jgi:mannose-1-phosphate guanylyltransferase
VVTSQPLVDSVLRQLPGTRVIGEPCRRDTAPCVGLAAAILVAEDPDAVLLVMPTDHVIIDRAAFATAVRTGVNLIAQDPSRIVTFGIPPSYPAESFGYIQRGQAIAEGDAAEVFIVLPTPGGKTKAGSLLGQCIGICPVGSSRGVVAHAGGDATPRRSTSCTSCRIRRGMGRCARCDPRHR